jgi:hypothetical protein
MKEIKVVTKINDVFGKTQMARLINGHFTYIITNSMKQSASQENSS